jgi:hypothetical protein
MTAEEWVQGWLDVHGSMHAGDNVYDCMIAAFNAGANSVKPDPHEIWAAAQLMEGEGIEDGVRRIAELL